jgi:hypothetical protein
MAEQKKREKQVLNYTTYSQNITFTCPTRGLVTQTVSVKRYDTPSPPSSNETLPELEELRKIYDSEETSLDLNY